MERKIYSTSCIHFVRKMLHFPETNDDMEWGTTRDGKREKGNEENSRLLVLQNVAGVSSQSWSHFVTFIHSQLKDTSDLLPFLHQILTFLADILWLFVHLLCISISMNLYIYLSFEMENHTFATNAQFIDVCIDCVTLHRKYHIIKITFANSQLYQLWHTESDALLCLFLIHLVYLLQFYYWHNFIHRVYLSGSVNAKTKRLSHESSLF